MRKIYIVEDDENIREVVQYALRTVGFEVTGYENGEEFFVVMEKEVPSLVLLDIMMPGEDGLSVLKKLRKAPQTKKLPVILLTAKGSELDKVKGLDLGADDYIAKPFGVMELISRINAVLRRSSVSNDEEMHFEYGGIHIDSTRRAVSAYGTQVNLTFKEYELLYYMMINKELALDRGKIMDAVWGFDFEGESRTLDMHIRSLRRKLGKAGENIKTIRSVGYRLCNRE